MAGEPKRLCLFLNSWTYGGVEQHVLLLCGKLRAHGYEPFVICAENDGLHHLHDGLRALQVPYSSTGAGGKRNSRVRDTVELVRLLRRERIDLLHAQLIFTDGGRVPLLAACVAGIPAVVTHHAAPRAREPLLSALLRKPFLAGVHRFVAVSHANARDHVRWLGLPEERVSVIHNGIPVPVDEPDRAAARQRLLGELSLPESARLVGAVGRLCEQKAFHRLLEVVPALLERAPHAHFIIVGSGPLRASLDAQVARLGIGNHVHWLGFRSDVAWLFAAFDVLAMPSEFEGLPLALLEAFAQGCPAVAHAVDGIPEIVEDGVNGFLVPHADARLLEEKLAEVLLDPALARRMSVQARRRALSSFTTERMVRDIVRLYDAALAERTGGAELLARSH